MQLRTATSSSFSPHHDDDGAGDDDEYYYHYDDDNQDVVQNSRPYPTEGDLPNHPPQGFRTPKVKNLEQMIFFMTNLNAWK